MRWVWLLAVAACGGSSSPPAGPARALGDAPPAGSDDLVVARVDGHPVWGSCVAAQATRTGGDRQAALRDCIAFELLAWRAAGSGYASDPAVADAVKTAMVARVVDDYEDHVRPEDLEPTWDKLMARALPSIRHPEYRGSTYVRIDVGSGAPASEDAAAHAAAESIAAALGREQGLSGPDLLPIAKPIADAAGLGSALASEDVPPTIPGGLAKPYADALYAIPEVGRTTGPVRTPWGWDVILFSRDVPAADPSDAEVRAQVLYDGRRLAFPGWVTALARSLGVHPEIEPDADKLLEDAP